MITLKSPQEIEIMKTAGTILRSLLQKIVNYVSHGKTTQEIDDYAALIIGKEDVIPAFLGYKGFPSNVCISVNEEVVHGIPSKRKILSGDIVSMDLGISYKGYFADSAVTLAVDKIEHPLKKLIRVTRESLYKGIKQAYPGNYLGNISAAIQSYVEANGFSVVRQFVGHGIGKNLQEEPEVPNFGKNGPGICLKEGMVLAIEPMVNMGGWEVATLDNNWTVVTKDKLPSAHFEHTVAITEKGPEVLT
ncbi:MAG: type I methionyl aminopeptidase [Candidatus Omnitrophota bacterium]